MSEAQYVIFEDGGKQYRAEQDLLIRVDYRDVEAGTEIKFDKVLLVSGDEVKVGTPAVEGASVTVTAEREEKGPKIRGLRRRHHGGINKRWGHRQQYTIVRVTKIDA